MQTLTVQELIKSLEKCFEMGQKMKSLDKPVKYDFTEQIPTKLCSWRGNYFDLTLDYGRIGEAKPLLLKDLLKDLETATQGKKFRGYKGDYFQMHPNTLVWADAWGNDYGRKIIGVENTPDFVILKTQTP